MRRAWEAGGSGSDYLRGAATTGGMERGHHEAPELLVRRPHPVGPPRPVDPPPPADPPVAGRPVVPRAPLPARVSLVLRLLVVGVALVSSLLLAR